MSDKMEMILNEAMKLRDELKLQANLGKAGAEDELEKLEPVFELLKEKSQKIADAAGDSVAELSIAAEMGIKADSKEDLDTALELAADELKKSYEKIKKLL